MITITVAGGTGTVTKNFGVRKYESVSIISPDNTPLYDFNVYDENGFFKVGANGIDAQKIEIEKNFQLRGNCSLVITNAVDDGIYQVDMVER